MPATTASKIKYRYGEEEDRVEAAKFAVTYKDVFSWEYLYTLLHEWFVDNGYAASKDEEFREILYEQVETAAGKEVWVRWRFTKTDTKVFSTIYNYDVSVDIHILGLKEVEIVLGGKKYKADKGEIEVQVKADLIRDPQKKLKKISFGKKSYKLILDSFLKSKQEYHEAVLYSEMEALQIAIKRYLKLETYLPEDALGQFKKKAKPE